jgi:hypothetical protein
MIRALGLPHLGQTSRWGAAIFGVLLRFWRRSVGIDSGCIGVSPIISNRRGQANLCGTRRGLPPRTLTGSGPLCTWTPTPYGRILPVSALQRPDWRRIMATTVGKVTIWSIVTLAAIVVIALILVSR